MHQHKIVIILWDYLIGIVEGNLVVSYNTEYVSSGREL